MNTQDNHKDEFIRKLVRRKGIEKAPDHFTERVMGRIKASPALDDTPLLSTGTWIAILAGLAAMIVLIFSVRIPFLNDLLSAQNLQSVSMNIFSQGFFNTMTSFFKGLNISGITWMIISAALGLVILDRILRKKFFETRMLMIF